MPGNVNLEVKIKADGSGLVGEVGRVEHSLGKVGRKGSQAGQQINSGLKRTPQVARTAGQAISSLQRRILALVAAGQVIRVFNGAVNAAVDFQRIDAALKSATGSVVRAREEFKFLEREAERLGFRLRDNAIQYAQFAAATRGGALEGEQTREIFLGAVEAATALGLSVHETSGILKALTQIVSKGNVSAEELRGQFGEKVAGAFELTAASMGRTTTELNQMLARGEILAVDLLPKLGRALRERFGGDATAAANNAQQAFNRFHNDLDILRRDFAESGFLDGLLGATSALRETFADPEFRDGLNALGENLGATLRFLVENHKIIATVLGTLGGLGAGAKLGKLFGPAGRIVTGLASAALGGFGASRAFISERTVESLRTEYQALEAEITGFHEQLSYLNPDRYVEIGGRAIFNADSVTHEQVSAALAKAVREQERIFNQLNARAHDLRSEKSDPLEIPITYAPAPLSSVSRKTPAPTIYDQLGKNGEAKFRRRQEAVRDGLTSLLPVYDQARASAALWRDEQLENLNRAAAGYGKFAAEVDTAYNGLLAQAHREEAERVKQNVAAEVAAAERIREARESQLNAVRDGLIDTLPVYDQAVARAKVWRDEQLAAFKVVGDGFEDYAEDVAQVYQTTLAQAHAEELKRIERQRVTRLDAARDWQSGAERSLAAYADSATNFAENVEGAFTRGFGEMENALVEFARHGRISFSSLADSILTDLARIYVRSKITGPLAQSLGLSGGSGGGGLLGGIFGRLFGGGNFASQFDLSSGAAGFADGGVMTDRGPLPLNKYANGGIARSPQLSLFGEGRLPEAFVPLQDGRTIPVTLKQGMGGGSGNAHIVNYYQYSIQVDVPRDGADIEARIEQGVMRAVQASVGAVAQRADRGGSFSRRVGRR